MRIQCSYTYFMGLPSLKVTRNPWNCRRLGLVVWSRFRVAASRAPSYRQEPGLEPSPEQLRGICFWKRNGFRRALRAAAGSGRSEHRNVDTLIPLARKRESPTGPNVPCERRTDPAEPLKALIPSASRGTLPLQNRRERQGICGVPSERSGCAPYPGFHPGLVCGAPLGHSECLTSL